MVFVFWSAIIGMVVGSISAGIKNKIAPSFSEYWTRAIATIVVAWVYLYFAFGGPGSEPNTPTKFWFGIAAAMFASGLSIEWLKSKANEEDPRSTSEEF